MQFLVDREILQAVRHFAARDGVLRAAVAFWGRGAGQQTGITERAQHSAQSTRILCDLLGGACNPHEIRHLSPRGRFAEMNVGTVLWEVSTELDTLRIVHDPLDAERGFEADPSHAQITGLPPGDSDDALLVGDLMADCVSDMHPAIVEHDG